MKIILEEKSVEPLYLQVKNQVKQHIIRNNLSEGTRLPSITEVAVDANVCIDTVQKAFSELIKEGYCFKRPKKGTFVGKSKLEIRKKIALVHHYLGPTEMEKNICDMNIYRGLNEGSKDSRMDLGFITHNPADTIAFYMSNRDFELSAVFIISMYDLEGGKQLAEQFPSLKFIFLGYNVEGFEETPDNVHGIFFDDFAGAYRMTQHLIEQGNSRIAVVSKNILYRGYHLRIDGCRQAMADNNLKLDDNLIFEEPTNSKLSLRQIGTKYGKTISAMNNYPTAVFCVNDYLAAGVKNGLTSDGSDKKITVTGYDNIFPELSIEQNFDTMSMDFQAIGRKALDIINGKKFIPKTLKLMPQILLRNHP